MRWTSAAATRFSGLIWACGWNYTDWTPLSGRNHLFPELVDSTDPWQFSNVVVN
jgi:homospermidine synthase